MTAIRILIEIEKSFSKTKKTPCDIMEFLEDETYSESKGEDIKNGDMHLTHYIRRQLRDEKRDDETIKKLNKKIRHLKEFIRLNIE
jgi:hypothetical protein